MNWANQAAELLRSECWLSGDELRRALGWWKMLRAGGKNRPPVSDADIAAAIKGLRSVARVERPWRPYKMFGEDRKGLFGEAASAHRKKKNREPRPVNEALRDFAEGIIRGDGGAK